MAVDDQYTVSLLHLDSDLTDESGKTWTASGGAAISTAQSKFGAGSLHAPTGSKCQSESSTDFSIDGPYTLDFWIYNINAYIIAYTGEWGGAGFTGIQATSATAGAPIGFQFSGFTQASVGLPTQEWAHVELGRDVNNVVRLFLNGEVICSKTQSGTFGGTTLTLGGSNIASGECYYAEVRFSEGICRHTAAFTPPTAPYGEAAEAEKSWLMHIVDGAIKGMKGAAKAAIPYYDGNKWVVKEAGSNGQYLTLDSNGDLAWIALPAATTSVAGTMSAADKTKLDGVATGATAYTDTAARAACVSPSITNGVTNSAPDQNAVFDALALKAGVTHADQHYPAGADPVNAQAYHGFVNRTDSTMTWTDSTPDRTLTITGTYTYYYQGNKIVVSTSKAAQITNTTGLWYFYFNSAGVLTASQSFPSFTTTVICAMGFWNGTTLTLYDERHGYQRNLDMHAYLHNTVGARYGSGLALTTAGAAGTATFSVATGSIWDEDLQFSTSAPATSGRIWYQTGATTWTFDSTPSTVPFRWNGATSRVQYVSVAGGYVVSDASTGRYVNVWVYCAPNVATPIKFMIETLATATGGYTTVAGARAVAPPNLSAMGLYPEMKLLYRLVVRGDGEIQPAVTADDYRNSSVLPSGGTPSSTAASVIFAPAGNLVSVNVQSAMEELDAEKQPIIVDNSITYAKIQQVSATDKLLGRATPGAGDIEEITCTPAGRALLDDVSAAAQRATLGTGYVLPVLAQIQPTPADGDTIYFGGIVRDVSTTGGNRRLYIPRAGIIKAAYVSMYVGGTAGTNENVSVYIRLNNTSDTLVQTIGSTDTWRIFSNTSLNISVAAGDYVEIKVVQPTWATNPTNVGWGGNVFVE